jgi:hypothetical protein
MRWFRNENNRRRVQSCIHCSVPTAGLISILCGTLLVISVLTVGVLSMGAVFIPVAIIGGVATLWLIGGGILGSCFYQDTDARTGQVVTRIAPSRPSPYTARRRAAMVSQLPHVETSDGEDGTCSICLCESPPERVVLHCGHKFHEQCITGWMTRARFARCPLCRSGLSTPRLEQPTGDVASEPVPGCDPVRSPEGIV